MVTSVNVAACTLMALDVSCEATVSNHAPVKLVHNEQPV
jgi:hypothetical protein